MTGSLGGRADAGFNWDVSYGAFGLSLGGSLNLTLAAQINAQINQDGLNGCFGAHVDAGGSLNMGVWGWSGSVGVSGGADGNICAGNGGASLSGSMYINLPFGYQPSLGFNIAI